LKLSYPLLREGTLTGWATPSLKAAETGLLTEQVKKEWSRLHYAQNLAVCFVNLEKCRLMLPMWQQLFNRAARRYQRLAKACELGSVHQMDVLKALEDRERVAAGRVELKNTIRLHERQIRYLSGLSEAERIESDGLLAFGQTGVRVPPAEVLLERARQKNLYTMVAENEKDTLRYQIEAKKKARYPTLDVSARLFDTGDLVEAEHTENWNIELKLKMDLLDFGRNQTGIEMALTGLRIKEEEIRAKQAEFELEVQKQRALLEYLLTKCRQAEVARKRCEALFRKAETEEKQNMSKSPDLYEVYQEQVTAEEAFLDVKREIRETLFTLRTLLMMDINAAVWDESG
jgi:outer membrane protein TolC